jgi:hypothetical protein
MTKTLFLILFVLPFFCSCKKGENTSADPGFSINGIHDLDMTQQRGDFLSLTVKQKDSSQKQDVAITVENLPIGVTATVLLTSGNPAISHVITFKNDLSSPGGTYPIKIVGTSAAGRKEYDLNLTITSFSGWTIGNRTAKVGSWMIQDRVVHPRTLDTNRAYIICNGDVVAGDDMISFHFSHKNALPKEEGQQYIFKTSEPDYWYLPQKDEVTILVKDPIGLYQHAQAGQTIALSYIKGRYTIKGNGIIIGESASTISEKELNFILVQ